MKPTLSTDTNLLSTTYLWLALCILNANQKDVYKECFEHVQYHTTSTLVLSHITRFFFEQQARQWTPPTSPWWWTLEHCWGREAWGSWTPQSSWLSPPPTPLALQSTPWCPSRQRGGRRTWTPPLLGSGQSAPSGRAGRRTRTRCGTGLVRAPPTWPAPWSCDASSTPLNQRQQALQHSYPTSHWWPI